MFTVMSKMAETDSMEKNHKLIRHSGVEASKYSLKQPFCVINKRNSSITSFAYKHFTSVDMLT